MPPREASAPGSMGKNRPWSRKYSLSALRVMPGSTTQSRSSAWTASTAFMSRKSIETPPWGALTWPSSEVPVPNGITGTRWAAQMRTVSCTSSVLCGNTTASGGWFSIQVVVLPCCSRTACEVTRRLPKRAASPPMAAATALGSRRAGAAACGIGDIGSPFHGRPDVIRFEPLLRALYGPTSQIAGELAIHGFLAPYLVGHAGHEVRDQVHVGAIEG